MWCSLSCAWSWIGLDLLSAPCNKNKNAMLTNLWLYHYLLSKPTKVGIYISVLNIWFFRSVFTRIVLYGSQEVALDLYPKVPMTKMTTIGFCTSYPKYIPLVLRIYLGKLNKLISKIQTKYFIRMYWHNTRRDSNSSRSWNPWFAIPLQHDDRYKVGIYIENIELYIFYLSVVFR